MGNQGIDYFPLNVDFFNDDKIELIEGEFGLKGSTIAIRLLCKIYHEGYYYQWGDDECLLFAKKMGDGIVPGLVKEVVQRLVKRSFFDERLFNSFQILTSKGIQKRYFEASKRRKDVYVRPEFLLIPIVKFGNVRILNENVNIAEENADNSEQSKVKEKKVKESIERKPSNEGKKKDELSFASPPSQRLVLFLDWVSKNAPWCYKNLKLPTEEDFMKLVGMWEVKDICNTISRLENKKKLRTRYSNLYVTVQSWLENDEEKKKIRRKPPMQEVVQKQEMQEDVPPEQKEEDAKNAFIRMLEREARQGKEGAKEKLAELTKTET